MNVRVGGSLFVDRAERNVNTLAAVIRKKDSYVLGLRRMSAYRSRTRSALPGTSRPSGRCRHGVTATASPFTCVDVCPKGSRITMYVPPCTAGRTRPRVNAHLLASARFLTPSLR